MVPQTHPPAAEAEVDFGEFTASIAGQVIKLYMFCMRLSHSGKAFHVGYANQTQESFLDGPCASVRGLRWGADRDDPLRQFETGGDPDRVGQGTLRTSPVRGYAVPLRLRLVLLRPRRRGSM
jgi:hypothetical protein